MNRYSVPALPIIKAEPRAASELQASEKKRNTIAVDAFSQSEGDPIAPPCLAKIVSGENRRKGEQ
jgi:hypothetical protein